PLENYADPFYALADVMDDANLFPVMGCGQLELAGQFAAHTPTYVYQFLDATAPNPTWVGASPGFVSGASHGSDEVYWFDRPFDTVAPLNEAQRRLAYRMVP